MEFAKNKNIKMTIPITILNKNIPFETLDSTKSLKNDHCIVLCNTFEKARFSNNLKHIWSTLKT